MSFFRRVFLATLVALQFVACAASGPPLNSDRIEQKFGSYGVDIIAQDERRRVASLFSGARGDRVTRTYAVVEFLGEARQEYRQEHAEILAGGSIGATFRSSGWTIRKQNLYIGELEIPEEYVRLGELMKIGLPATVAAHQYLFVVSNEERSFSYARITELHHPEFAGVEDLHTWYGEIILDDSNRDSIHDFIGPPAAK